MIIDDVHRGIVKRKNRKRVGRGPGSGHGKTGGRGVAHARHYESLIALASSTAFLRMGFMLWLIEPALAKRVALPLSAMVIVGLVLGFTRHQPEQVAPERHKFENPLTMRVAFTFAAIYASVTLLLAYARQEFGDVGIYAVSGLAALVGADAPALSIARLVQSGNMPIETATLAVMVVAVFTTLGKVAILVSVGRSPFARRVSASLMSVAATGALALLLLHRVW
jgi:uncharacterized membrane protein (DUF4010 family)